MITDDTDYARLCRRAHDWRTRLQLEDATDADKAAFEAWLAEDIRHEEAYDRSVTFIAAYKQLQPGDIDADLMAPSKVERTSSWLEQAKAAFAPTHIRILTSAIVAAVVAASVIFTLAPERAAPQAGRIVTAYATDVGEVTEVTLNDGTVVTIGARTEIRTTISAEQRVVELNGGAALFDVAHDPSRPFLVKAGDLTATALGTQFSVRNNGGVSRVAVSEGSVRVAYPLMLNGEPGGMVSRETLNAGQQVAATTGGGLQDVTAIEPGKVAAWRERKLDYDGATLAELVADANRYSNRTIVLAERAAALGERRITAGFRADDIDGMLVMLAHTYTLDIDEDDSGLIILRSRADEGAERR